MAWHSLSAGSRAAKAADARRTARGDDANEPQIARIPQASAVIDSLTIPTFVPSANALAADSRAPTWNLIETPSRRHASNMLGAALKAALGTFSRGSERPRHPMLTMRDPSFTASDRAPTNERHDDIGADRKQAIR